MIDLYRGEPVRSFWMCVGQLLWLIGMIAFVVGGGFALSWFMETFF